MVVSNLLVLIVLLVFALAVLGALIVIGLAIYISRTKTNGSQPAVKKELTEEQAEEITATWNLLNH
ncbi:MAG: hypothetical protein EHM70_22970 [Chloroflexota bacterium]|nr:MAG: hypothetical protein EHM70_22970 [Chloroflexota bacterium]